MPAFKESERNIQPQPAVLTESVPYRGGVVTISANPDRLKLDFLTEAQKRPGVDPEKAAAIAEGLLFFFDKKLILDYPFPAKKVDTQDHPRESLFFRAIERLIRPSNKTLLDDCSAAVIAIKGEPRAVLLKPKEIAYTYPSLKDARPEIQEAAIIQGALRIWKHEREHLLRYLEPAIKKNIAYLILILDPREITARRQEKVGNTLPDLFDFHFEKKN